MVIKLSKRFKVELKVIFDFIAQDSRARAISFKSDLFEKISILEHSPYIGRKVDETRRELIFKGYVVPYFVDNDRILILGIYKENLWDI